MKLLHLIEEPPQPGAGAPVRGFALWQRGFRPFYLLASAFAAVSLVASVQASAALWSAGFGLFAVRYWPVLTRPRLDGKPG